jgi:ATP-binding cassette subfamily B protein RaxB
LSVSIGGNIACLESIPDHFRIVQSANMAAIHEDIGRFGMQYGVLIGYMGRKLSGGQKQRPILARAQYRGPKTLFLVEPTSHLDLTNKQSISKNVRGLKLTRVIVAHRKETIDSTDYVPKLETLKDKKQVAKSQN